MSRLSVEDLREIGTRVFAEQQSTLKDEADGFSFDELRDTALLLRRVYVETLGKLPDSALEAQPANAEGNEVWSAGQVSSHLSDSSLWVENSIRQALGKPEGEQSSDLSPLTGTQLLDRGDAIRAMEYANRDFQKMLEVLPADIDPSAKTEHDYFGTMTIKAWLLMDALHTGQHVEQIRALGQTAPA